jgi:hypothetical protein
VGQNASSRVKTRAHCVSAWKRAQTSSTTHKITRPGPYERICRAPELPHERPHLPS